MSFCELHARSAFSFLRGGSNPELLAEACARARIPAMALCDRDGVYGAPRFHRAARERGVRPIVGCELTMEDGSVLPLLVESQRGYRNLCRLLTGAQLRAAKGESKVEWSELQPYSEGLVFLTGDREGPIQQAWDREGPSGAERMMDRLCSTLPRDQLYVEIQRHSIRGENRRVKALVDLAERFRRPILASNGVCYATPAGRAVQDLFTCLREKTHLDAAGRLLSRNSEGHVKDAEAMEKLFRDHPEAVSNTESLAERLEFSLEKLGYEFPKYPVPVDETMDSFLRKITWFGAEQRYGGLTPKVRTQLQEELRLIAKLGFSGYFLIVWDLVNFCRERKIMVQGRGSAANSAVCYSLGITAVDPIGGKLLFERFLSEGRKEWPDIDLDLPSGDRREMVIQEVYRRYGKHGAAMTANVITYRGRSAMREIGKALNFPPATIDRLSNLFSHRDHPHPLHLKDQLARAGVEPNHPRAPALVSLYKAIYGLPRHLGQHPGGMIICQGDLSSIVPLENCAMPDRVVAQWDKEDCNSLGIIKVDLLGLGMMAAIQDALELTRERGRPVDLAKIPKDDPATFELIRKADTIGVFQIESRAQISTLPRMKPKTFYDLVIAIAIIRPGPIQGNLVHPYLDRRAGRAPIEYIDERLKPVLERTLGVPLFQEQMLRIAMIMADFSGAQAEELRRAISFHRSVEQMQKVQEKLRLALERKKVPAKVTDQITAAINSFALYGFPESHAISFALLAYGSAYLKAHCAVEFHVAVLNNQPMGFYSPATIVQDARRHGIRVRAPCVVGSGWPCTVIDDATIRLGLRLVKGLRADTVSSMEKERSREPFSSLRDLRRRTHFSRDELRALAATGALNALVEHRRSALWQVEEQFDAGGLFENLEGGSENLSPLEMMNDLERLKADYKGTGLTVGPHPMKSLRPKLKGIWRTADLKRGRHGTRLKIAGCVICRQRPETAKGFLFMSLEDETGVCNAVVSPKVFQANRHTIIQEHYLIITGSLQNIDGVICVKARHFEALVEANLPTGKSYDFH